MMEDAGVMDEEDERAGLLSGPKRLSVIQTLAMWQVHHFTNRVVHSYAKTIPYEGYQIMCPLAAWDRAYFQIYQHVKYLS